MAAKALCDILIVDDELLIRQGIKHYVHWEQEGFRIVGEASNGKEALAMIEAARPHIKLSKKQKGSRNRDKAKQKIQRAHDRITNQRKDFLHRLSYHVVQAYSLICIEDLSVQRMMNNHRLAKSIANASWHRLSAYLAYKSVKYGKRLIKVPPEDTSQACSDCEKLVRKSLSERVHQCPYCGLTLDRDENAARNILKRGLNQIAKSSIGMRPKNRCGSRRIYACGDYVRPAICRQWSLKQEAPASQAKCRRG